MACANEKCRNRLMCELKTTESINPADCDQYKTISGWYWQLINGLRDKPGEDDIPFSDEDDFSPEDFDDE